MKTILFPTDFSESTAAAQEWARLFARQYKATLVLLHVRPQPMPEPSLLTLGDMNPGTTLPVDTDVIESADRDQLTKLAAQFGAGGITCQTDWRWGAVQDGVLSAADEHRADLIITGRGHPGNFFERLVGTEATGIARKAHCPVLVVPADDAKPAQLHSMLFSTNLDFDQNAEFGQATALARDFGAQLSVLHVHAENQPSLSNNPEMVAQLQQVYGAIKLPVHTVAARTVTGGIDHFLQTNHPDLLVMTSRERDFLTGLLITSLTDKMVTRTNMPVLIYHAHGDL